jgi:hypothetical protein
MWKTGKFRSGLEEHGERLKRLTLAFVGAAYAGAAAWVGDRAFWSPDSSIRYVQLVSLLRQRYEDVAAVYPGAWLDPEARFYPVSKGFAAPRDGKVYLLYPPFFPALVAPFFEAAGRAGLVMVPMVAGFATVWLSWRWLRQFGCWVAQFGTVLVGAGTPLIVYSVVFWDHSLVTALVTAGLYLVSTGETPGKWRRLLAGVVLGIGTWFRNEGYVFAAAVLAASAAALPRRSVASLGAGLVCGAAPGWAMNWHLYGHPLGLKGLAGVEAARARLGGLEGWLWQRALAAYDLLFSTEQFQNAWEPVRAAESLGFVAVVVVAALLLREGLRTRNAVSAVFAGAAVALATAWVVTRPDAEVMGLIPAVPALGALAIWNPSTDRERLVGSAALLYVLAVVAVGSEGGLQWGPRYLLPAIPALGWLCSLALARAWRVGDGGMRRALGVCGVLLVSASVAVQVRGLLRVRSQVETGARVEAIFRAVDSPILVTGREGLFRVMGYLYFERVLMSVRDPQELRALVDVFSRHQVRRWTYIPFSGAAFDARGVERQTAGKPWRFEVVEDRTPLVFVSERGGGSELRLITYEGKAAAP